MTHDATGSSGSIALTKLRELDLEAPSQPGRPAHLSAASGLVRAGDMLYVIADDEVHLGVFSLDPRAPGRLLRLRRTPLDLETKARKRAKPDFEALVHLPALGGLLALGSGSKAQRVHATWLELDANGRGTAPRSFDLTPLYAAIASAVGEVNVEGAVAQGDRLLLFQRGNKGRGINAVLGIELSIVLGAIERNGLFAAPAIQFVRRYDLGSIANAPLCFSDAAALPDDSVVFSAVAENTFDAYADGAFAGAAIGVIDTRGVVVRLARAREAAKIEGIHAEMRGPSLQLLLVTDADDPNVPAVLYGAELAL